MATPRPAAPFQAAPASSPGCPVADAELVHTGDEMAAVLSQGRDLADRLTSTHATVFAGSAGVRDLYVDVFRELISEAETVPGYGTAMALLIERYAFVWATQKAADTQESPLSARDYEGLILRFRQLWEALLKARDDRQADQTFKAQFVTQFMRTFSEVCDEVLEEEQSTEIQRRVVDRMRTSGAADRVR